MDAISSLGAGLSAAQMRVNGAAQQLASGDTPSAIVPNAADPSAPGSPTAHFGVDPAEQLTTLMMAADAHHVTATAMRVALSAYQDSVGMLTSGG